MRIVWTFASLQSMESCEDVAFLTTFSTAVEKSTQDFLVVGGVVARMSVIVSCADWTEEAEFTVFPVSAA